MSRVGKKPIAVPSGVEFSVKDNVVTVKGPKGTLTKEFNNNITIKLKDGSAMPTLPTRTALPPPKRS